MTETKKSYIVYVFRLKVSQILISTDDYIMFAVLNVLPEKSELLNDTDFLQLDHKINITCTQFKVAILIGDMNVRTATLSNFLVLIISVKIYRVAIQTPLVHLTSPIS